MMNIARIFKKRFVYISIAVVIPVFFCSVFLFRVRQENQVANSFFPDSGSLLSKNTPIRILFVGDMMFDRYIRQTIDARGQEFILQKVHPILQGNDLIVGNLEGPITENASVSVSSRIGERDNYIFTFDPKIVELLNRENIKLVNLGNNHISNFGSEGLTQTRDLLSQAGVRYFGDPENQAGSMAIEKIGNRSIAFVNYNQFLNGSREDALNLVQSAKQSGSDFIVMYTHWGAEFLGEPSESIRNLAHSFVESGADVIIGSHPHVIQSKEKYQGKMIYYSLGNFVFDQYFDPNTQKGLAVRMDIDTQGSVSFEDFPVRMQRNGQTILEN